MDLALKDARMFIIDNQLLSNRDNYSGLPGTQAVIEQLGYIQIDTISVIERAHHHILWSRIENYQKDFLTKLEKERIVFEYWAHAASYLPICDFRYSLVPKKRIIEGSGHWRPRNKKWNKFVHDRIRSEGPLMSRDFIKDKSLSEDHAWGGHPVSHSLRQLFMEGKIMISGRQGFQKIYDLTERVLPDHIHVSVPSEEEYFQYLITRDLKAHGLMKATEIGHLINIPGPQLNRHLNELIEKGILLKVTIHGVDATPYYALKEKLNNWSYKRRKRRIHVLSPFDNLVIQRKRLSELFNFDYLLECYVPAEKRKWGYFCLPLLYGPEFIGRIDLKADRKRKVMIIKNLIWEEKAKRSKQIEFEMMKTLNRFSAFNACEEVEGEIG